MVALCAASAVYCLLRRRGCAGEERRAAGGEAVMGFGMAAMALPAAVLTPPVWSWSVYAVVFGVASLRARQVTYATVSPGASGHAPCEAGTAGGVPGQ
ncbi:DUF5134 domain-containing protein, partial [Streptomyces sp. ms191]|uniref:DUF5134 domain-containing protein n=1 Tax=Streptomyces sp. ms191 TaxID=1827978 RepID=UPI0011CDC7F4